MHADHHTKLKSLGFVPGVRAYQVHSLDGRITVKTIRQALFSSYRRPVTVPFEYQAGDPELQCSLPMVVELAQALYEPFRVHDEDTPIGCWEYPSWYLRGYLFMSPFDENPETIRMHAWLECEPSTGEIDTGIVQLVRDTTDIDPDAPIPVSYEKTDPAPLQEKP